MDIEQLGPEISFNVAIAVEHMVLRAVELIGVLAGSGLQMEKRSKKYLTGVKISVS